MSIFGIDSFISNTDIVCVFSFQKRILSYTGPCCKIRRSSDNSTNIFYFMSDGNIDYDALRSWIENSDAFLEIWYDQNVGATNHLIMNTLANQPKITSSPGTLSLTDKNILKSRC